MNIVLTICSSNYLAHAKTLGDSVLEYNPDVRFVIGLVDVLTPEIDLVGFQRFEILDVEKTLTATVFQELLSKYYLVELNTAVKPYLMDYLYKRDPLVKTVSYFDPDIKVYSSLLPLFQNVRDKGIIVTPHGCTYDDSSENIAGELSMLACGMYNLGFIATSRSDETCEFLRWWMLRLRNHCTHRTDVPGTFFDQNWVMLAGIYFRNFYVEKNPGYNVAWWNLFERKITTEKGRYVVNEQAPLFFVHFSAYKPEHDDHIAWRVQIPMGFDKHPELKPLFDDYKKSLLDRGYANFKSLKWGYTSSKENRSGSTSVMRVVKSAIILMLSLLPAWFKKMLIGILKQSLAS